jgi:penicillin-binding protein 2
MASEVTRRELFVQLFAIGAGAASLQGNGTSLVLSLNPSKLVHAQNPEFAAGRRLQPASTVKPFSLKALLDAGKLGAEESFLCNGRLKIGSHVLNCVHPRIDLPMTPELAIAYSCNGATAHFAQRFSQDELPRAFLADGFEAITGLRPQDEAAGIVRRNTFGESAQLQALGEEGVKITSLELLLAYSRLARAVQQSKYTALLRGLEGAVDFGTAQAAKAPGLNVAGKTGSIVLDSGSPLAWFAGFAPSRAPRLAVVVALAGNSGGADAAPKAAELFTRFA